MAGRSKAYLKNLRKKYRLGEFAKVRRRRGKKRRRSGGGSPYMRL